MGFQSQVNLQPAPAVAGDFASANPRASVLAGEGGLVAGLSNVFIGRFAWVSADAADPNKVYSFATAPREPDGFVHREQQGIITQYLAEQTMLVRQGFPITLHNEGDFWALLAGSNPAVPGSAIYADYDTGEINAVAASGGAVATGSIGATFTATGTGTSLVVTAVTGYITAGAGTTGDIIAGVGVPVGTRVIAQVSGTTGGAGTYTTSVATTAAAATVTSYGNVLNITAVSSGTLAVGTPVSGTGVPANAVISGLVTGAGGVGRYTISVPATAYAASTAITGSGGVLTRWKARSYAAVGELVKISTWG